MATPAERALVEVVGLRHWRQLRNFSQAKLAQQLGVCLQTVSDWETGRAQPRLVHARRLLRLLNAPSIDVLFPEHEEVA